MVFSRKKNYSLPLDKLFLPDPVYLGQRGCKKRSNIERIGAAIHMQRSGRIKAVTFSIKFMPENRLLLRFAVHESNITKLY